MCQTNQSMTRGSNRGQTDGTGLRLTTALGYRSVSETQRPLVSGSVSKVGRRSAANHVPQQRRSNRRYGTFTALDLRLLGYLKGVIDFDAEIPHSRLQLGVPQE